MATPFEQQCLRVQRLRQHLWQEQRLGRLERKLDSLEPGREVARKEVRTSELRCDGRQVGIRGIGAEKRERLFETRNRLIEPPRRLQDVGKLGRRAGGWMRLAFGLKEPDRRLEVRRLTWS